MSHLRTRNAVIAVRLAFTFTSWYGFMCSFQSIRFSSVPLLSVIRQLVISSGKKGLEAFLPHAHRVAEFAIARSPPSTADRRGGGDRDPFLPLASSWKQIDFSLESVLAPWVRYNAETTEARAAEPEGRDGGHGAAQQLRRSGVNVREWAMRAMARYRFVLGEYFDHAFSR